MLQLIVMKHLLKCVFIFKLFQIKIVRVVKGGESGIGRGPVDSVAMRRSGLTPHVHWFRLLEFMCFQTMNNI